MLPCSLKRFQNDASEVRDGQECGIRLADFSDYRVGDVIEFEGLAGSKSYRITDLSVVEPTGHEHIVLFRAGEATFTARVPAERRMKPGEAVPLAIRTHNAHLFDAGSGQRLG